MESKVHRVRFYNPKPLGVNSLSFNYSKKLLSISREDASIEIWDMNHNPVLLKSIPGFENGSVEALGWVGERLVSTGMGGALIEWDLERLTSKWSALLTGYAGWCIDVNSANTHVAVGTEQGYVNLFQTEADRFEYVRLFDKQEGRIISCKFDKTGNMLVTGSIAAIRIWDVSSGLALHQLQASRRGKQTLVWSLAVLSDMTIISGDSEGRLIFWDGKTAEQIEAVATHRADILSLVVSSDERTIYCAGVDPVIACFTRVEVQNKHDDKRSLKWVPSTHRQIHNHDVRCMALQGNNLYSLGVDGYMTRSSYPPKFCQRLPPMPPGPRVHATRHAKHNLIVLKYSDHIQVWKLGKYSRSKKGNPIPEIQQRSRPQSESEGQNQSINRVKSTDSSSFSDFSQLNDSITRKKADAQKLKLESKPVKMLSIRTKGNRQVKCCTISPNGKLVMYATEEAVRIFNVELGDEDGEDVQLVRTPLVAPGVTTCSHATFTDDSRLLVLHDAGVLQTLHADPAGAALHQRIETAPHLKASCLLHLETASTADSDATYLVCADTCGGAAVWRRAGGGRFQHHVTLPRYKSAVAALAVDRSEENLLLVYADNKVVEYNLKECEFNAWPSHIPDAWRSRRSAVTGACYVPHRADKVILYDYNTMWVFNRRKLLSDEPSEPEKKKKTGKKTHHTKLPFKTINFKYLAGMCWVEEDEAVVLELPPDNILSQLPPTLAVSRFVGSQHTLPAA